MDTIWRQGKPTQCRGQMRADPIGFGCARSTVGRLSAALPC
jgi:hypothetical protein